MAMDWFKLFDWDLFYHFSLQFNLECPIAVRFMQELDHQFFMPVFWMSCCEGRLGANILTNKCIIWGLEPRSVACPIFMSLSPVNTVIRVTARARENQQGFKLYSSSEHRNLPYLFRPFLMIGIRCLVWWIPLLFPLTLIIHHLMLAQ